VLPWLALAFALLSAPAVSQDVFFASSGGRSLQNAKSNARLSKAEKDISLVKDDRKTIHPFARREIAFSRWCTS